MTPPYTDITSLRPRPGIGSGPLIHWISSGATAVAVALIWVFSAAAPLAAMDLTAELSLGYDSNPALIESGEGSGFSAYGMGGGHVFKWYEDLMLDVFAEGRYQDYWQVEDDYRIQAGTTLTYSMADDRLSASVLGEVAAYRDKLVEADERDEAMIGIGAEWILTNRLNVGFEQSCRWLNYLNWAKAFSGKGQGRNSDENDKGGKQSSAASSVRGAALLSGYGPGGPGKGDRPLKRLYSPRNNRLLQTAVNLDVFLLSVLSGRVYATYGDLDSSLDMESYRELAAGLGVSWTPAHEWRVGFEARGSRVRYHSVPEKIKRVREINTIWFLGMDVSRFWGDFELFGQLGWTSGEAPLDYSDYTQTVILCGISYVY